MIASSFFFIYLYFFLRLNGFDAEKGISVLSCRAVNKYTLNLDRPVSKRDMQKIFARQKKSKIIRQLGNCWHKIHKYILCIVSAQQIEM